MSYSFVMPGNAEFTRVVNAAVQPTIIKNDVEIVVDQMQLPTVYTINQYGGKLPNIVLTNTGVNLSGAAYQAMVQPGFIGCNMSGAQAGAGFVFGPDSLENANFIKGSLNLTFDNPTRMFAVQNNTGIAVPADVVIGNSSATANFVQFTNGGQSVSGSAVLFPAGSAAGNAYVIASLANAGITSMDGSVVAQNIVNFNVVYP